MALVRTALTDARDVVQNVILFDSNTMDAPAGLTARATGNFAVNPGDTFDGNSVTPKSPTEIDIALANRQTLFQKAAQGITANNTFLALGSPTNAQVLAQVQTLTKENTALIKLAVGLLSDTNGT